MNVESLNKGIEAELTKAAVSNLPQPPEKRKSIMPYVLGAGALGLAGYGAYKGLQKFDQNNAMWGRADQAAAQVGKNISPPSTPNISPLASKINTANDVVLGAGGIAGTGHLLKVLGQKALGKATTGPGSITRTLTSKPLMAASGASGFYSMTKDPLVQEAVGNNPNLAMAGAGLMTANPMVGAIGSSIGNHVLANAHQKLNEMEGESQIMGDSSKFLLDNFNQIRHNDPQKQEAARRILSWVGQNQNTLPTYEKRFPATYNLIGRATESAQQSL